MSTPWRRHLHALGLYVLLSLLLTLPLALHIATRVPGDGIDDPALAWNLWWIKFSLVDRQIDPFVSGWMFYPIGINLAFYTLTVLNGLLSVPLQVSLGLVPASNLVLVSSFALSGYGTYLLARDTLGRPTAAAQDPAAARRAHLAALLAGLLFAFSSSKLFYASLGQFNIASSQWVPFAVLYSLRALRSGHGRGWQRDALLTALFLLLQAYAELTYASFLVIFIGLLAVWQVVQHRSRGQLARLARTLIVLGAVFLVGLLPVLGAMLPDLRAEGDFMVEGGGFADIFSADLAGYALPTQLHPVLGDLVRQQSGDSTPRADGSEWQVNKGQHITLGLVGLVLIMSGAWAGRRRGAAFWAAAVVLFFWLTLGPSLRIAGHDTGLPGPFRVLQTLPFFKGNRYPSRFSVMLLVCAAPLLAWGAQRALAAWQGRRAGVLAALLAGLLVFENLSVPLPTADMRLSPIYATIAADPAPGAVLDLPVGWRNGFSVFGKQDPIIMAEQWQQTGHGKPIVGGNTSRNPEYKFTYFLQEPLLAALTVLANATDANPHIREQMTSGLTALAAGDPGLGGNTLLLEAARVGASTLQALDVRYIVLHGDHAPAELAAFVERTLPVTLVAQHGADRLYRVELPAPPSSFTITPALDPLSRGEGWSEPSQGADGAAVVWAQRRATRLLLPPAQPTATRLTVAAAAAGPDQTLALRVNGVDTASQPLPLVPGALVFDLPAGALHPGVNDVTLRFGRVYPVSEIAAPASLAVASAGLEAGNYAHIWLNGVDIAPNTRGYNLALVDSRTWQSQAVAAFDTHADPAASAALVSFLRQMDEHSVLAVAIRDTAGAQLSDEAAAALAALGLDNLQGRLRWSQAAIAPGQALLAEGWTTQQQTSGLQAARVHTGPAWTEPRAAAQVFWVRVGE